MATRIDDRTASRFALRCWGDFTIRDVESGLEQRPRGRKARALVAYLALHPDRRISRERLTALLWSDRADEQARSSLRQSLFELKPLANGAGLLAVERDAVTLNGAALGTDLDQYAALADAGDAMALAETLPDPDERLFADLDGLSEGFDEWLAIERTRRRDELVALIADASARAVAAGQVRAARTLHARLLAFEPELERSAPALPVIEAPAPPARSAPTDNAPTVSRRNWLAGGAAALAVAGVGGWWLRRERPAVRPEVRALYQSANAIIYQRRSASYPMAADLLRRALAIDPGYAPAWAGLAAATAMGRQTPEKLLQGERYARRAIAVDPSLGKAHGVLGMVLGFQSAEAQRAIRKAAALSPDDPEILFWLSNVEGADGNFPAQLTALRRAAAIDPFWHRSSGKAALIAYELGYPDEARRHIERVQRVDPRAAFNCAYAVDWARGDYAEVVRTVAAVRSQPEPADMADWKLGNALLILGHVEPARLLLRLPPELWEVARGGPPSGAAFVRINREAEIDEQWHFCLETAFHQLLKAGRGAEMATLVDAREGRAGNLLQSPNAGALLTGGVHIALALRQAGRDGPAERLLAQTEAAMRRSYAFGAVPNWLDANVAQLWALRKQKPAAVAALARAMKRGWHYAPTSPVPDLADVPAFALLAGDSGFEALRARQSAHIERQRAALGAVPI